MSASSPNKKAAQALRKEAKYDRRLLSYKARLGEAMALLKKQNELITWLKDQPKQATPTEPATISTPYLSSSDQSQPEQLSPVSIDKTSEFV